MSLLIATQTELIKTKRSSAFWMSLIGSGMIPLIFFLVYTISPEKNIPKFQDRPWDTHLFQGWNAFSAFLLPMFVTLICSLIPQIEYKNNTWKQVFASPQSVGTIFFSKYLAIMLMVLFLFLMFNVFMILVAVIANAIHGGYGFFNTSIDWSQLARMNFKVFIALLAVISIQYWLSLRFKNFIIPIGIGLACLVATMILISWKHSDKIPYAFPFLTFNTSVSGNRMGGPFFQNHELNSIGYFLFFTVLAFLDMRFRKERG